MADAGYFILGTWRGARLRIHWTAPVGAFIVGHFAWAPAFWGAFIALILIHELGHAFVVNRVGAHVVSIDVAGIGGSCQWRGNVTPLQRACIAWAGVWAQLILYALTIGSLQLAPSVLNADVLYVFTTLNLIVVALNLLPARQLDGASAWRLFPLLMKRLKLRWLEYRLRALHRRHEKRDAQFDAHAKQPAETSGSVVDLQSVAKRRSAQNYLN